MRTATRNRRAGWFVLLLAWWPAVVAAAEITDSAGRAVAIPATVARIMPAGPPADVLLLALDPEQLVGLVEPFKGARKELVPAPYRDLAAVPRLTRDIAPADVAAVKALHPDLIVDYGDIAPRYVAFANAAAAATGVPYVLFDGKLAQVPGSVRALAHLLDRDARGEEIARAADAVLAALKPLSDLPDEKRVPVYYARGNDGLQAIRTGSTLDEAVAAAGGRNVVPAGKGAFAKMTVAEVAKLAPQVVVVADPEAAAQGSPLRAALPASTLFLVDRGAPFHWMEEPPSLNRLLGAAWLAAKLHPEQARFGPADAKRLSKALLGLDLADAAVADMLR